MSSHATHLMGMDISYTYAGMATGNNICYTVTLQVYLDCDGEAAEPEYEALISSPTNGSFLATLDYVSNEFISPICDDSLVTFDCATQLGVYVHTYQGTVCVPNGTGIWDVSITDAFMNEDVSNLVAPLLTEMHIETSLISYTSNSSPIFNNYGVQFFCNSDTNCVDLGATDPNGNTLQYSLITPQTSSSGTATYNAGYNNSNPFDGFISIDQSSGELCFYTALEQYAVVHIQIDELNSSGVVINSTTRAVQIIIEDCTNENPILSDLEGDFDSYFVKDTIMCNQPVWLTINGYDPDASDLLTMSGYSNNSSLNSAITVNNNGTALPSLEISGWIPPVSTNDVTYTFDVTLTDDACPYNATVSGSYNITILGSISMDPVPNICEDDSPIAFPNASPLSNEYFLINGLPPVSTSLIDPSDYGVGSHTIQFVNPTLAPCDTIVEQVFNIYQSVNANIIGIPYLCDDSDSTLLVASPIPPGFSYIWNAVGGLLETTSDLMVYDDGTYYLNVTDDATGCSDSTSIIVYDSPTPTASVPNIQIIPCDTTTDIVVSNSSGYTFEWNTGDTTSTLTNVGTGSYWVIVTDIQTACSDTLFSDVLCPGIINGDGVGNTIVLCEGDSIILEASTVGINVISYLWNTGETSNSIWASSTGLYEVEVTDDLGDVYSAVFNVNVLNINTQITYTETDLILCEFDSITLTASPNNMNWMYEWNTGETNGEITVYNSGEYSVIVSDSAENCFAYDTISVISIPDEVNILGDLAFCEGDSTLLYVEGLQDYELQWSTGSTDTSIYVSTAGSYYLSVYDSISGCLYTDSFNVIENPNPSISFYGNDYFCEGGYNSISIGPTLPNHFYSINGNGNYYASASSIGWYVGEITNAVTGCSVIDSIYIDEYPNPSEPTIYGLDTICPGDSAIVYVNSEANVSYLWSNGDTDTLTTLYTAGSYTLTVSSDTSNCETQVDFTLDQFNLPEISFDDNNFLCEGDSLELFANPINNDYTYLWTNNGSTNTSIMVYDEGFYPIIVTDTTTGCVNIDSAHVHHLNATELTLYDAYFCEDSIMISADYITGYDYLWENGYTANYTYVYGAGEYVLDYVDYYGCPNSDTLNVYQLDTIVDPSFDVTFIDCNTYLFESTDTINNSYWDFGNGITSSAYDTIVEFTDGTFEVMHITSNTCSSDTVYYTIEHLVEFSIIGDTTLCDGFNTNLVVSGLGNFPINYSFLWNDGSIGYTNSVNAIGTYSVEVTDSFGCVYTDSIEVTMSPLTEVSLSVSNMLCNVDTALLVATSNIPIVNYYWSENGSPFMPGDDSLIIYNPGEYIVGVQDTNGCVDFDTLTVGGSFNVSIQGFDNPCVDSDTLTVFADPSADILWSTGSTNTFTTVYTSGTYWVTVTDSFGCTFSDTIEVFMDSTCCYVDGMDIEIYGGATEADLYALNGNSYYFFGLDILLNGVIDIDMTGSGSGVFEFENCNIYMGPFAQINFDGGALKIIRSTFEAACDTMWNGIVMKSKALKVESSHMQDALTLFKLEGFPNACQYDMNNNTFINNLKVLHTAPTTASSSSFYDNVIDNDRGLYYPHLGEPSFMGIYLDKPDGIVIGNYSSNLVKNFIRNMDYGVFAYIGNYEIYNTVFDSIYDTSPEVISPGFLPNTACVYADGFNFLGGFSSTIGGTNNKANTFKNFTRGIDSYVMNNNIEHNTFNNGDATGIRVNYAEGLISSIRYNLLEDVNTAITTRYSDYGNVNIIKNEILRPEVGVFAANLSSTTPNFTLVKNNCIFESSTAAISATTIMGIRIEENFIDDAEDDGITLTLAPRTSVYKNVITPDAYNNGFGTFALLSNNSRFELNRINPFFAGSVFMLDNDNTHLKNNYFINPDYGVALIFGGIIGPQGTATDPWNNRWYGLYSIGSPQLFSFGLTDGSLSPFYINPTLPEFNPIFSEMSMSISPISTPLASASPYVNGNGWFTSCPNLTAPGPTPILSAPILATKEAIATAGDDTYEPSTYLNKKSLHKKLNTDSVLLASSTILQNFMDSVAATEMAKINYMIEYGDERDYATAMMYLDSIFPSNGMEQNSKTVYNILYTHLADSGMIYDLPAQAVQDLRDIAELCPNTDGDAVIVARSICRYFDEGWVDYNADCDYFNVAGARFSNKSDDFEFEIFPNPTDGFTNLKFVDNTTESMRVIIYNSLGQIVSEIQLQSGLNHQLNTTDLQAGIYVCNLVDVNNAIKASKKLNIIR